MRRRFHSKESKTQSSSSRRQNNNLDSYFNKSISLPKPITISNDTQWKCPVNNGLDPASVSEKQTILYPKNPEVRAYQLSMVRTCLFHNTLVCLPTGLGKTHIASVVMMNYYLSFPNSKIYFLAPTRPLVYQQKNSLAGFYEYIKEDDIIELNGSLSSKIRIGYYKSKRVFFLTPQTLDNDLLKNRCNINETSLIILDQAHRATGNYAYVNIIKHLQKSNLGYRIVGLSATPGNTIEAVQQVITNLRINRIQVKDETDPDVKPYIHDKHIQAIEIKATEMINVAQKIIDGFMKKPLGVIVMKQAVEGYIVNLLKLRGLNQGVHYQMYQSFKNNEHQLKQRLDRKDIGLIYASFKILKYLVDGKKTLKEQGYESFICFLRKFKQKKDERTGQAIPFLKQIVESEEFSRLEDIFKDGSSNHPKLIRLQNLLNDFFSNQQNIQNQSKVIVFTHHRTSAMQIQRSLAEVSIIKSYIFVGQSKTLEITTDSVTNIDSISYIQMKQKQQIQVVRKFKQNQLNTLISTSIGEEGLDIGQVDLIICYDNGMSPIRMVQRMGRTGRKRNGKVILLLMEGKEMQSYKNATFKSKNLKSVIKDNAIGKKCQKTKFQFYSFNSVMYEENKSYELVYIDNQKPKQPQPQECDYEDSNQLEIQNNKKEKKLKAKKKPNKKQNKQQSKITLTIAQHEQDTLGYFEDSEDGLPSDLQKSQDSDTMIEYLMQIQDV